MRQFRTHSPGQSPIGSSLSQVPIVRAVVLQCVCVCVCVVVRLGAEGRVRVGESVAVLDKTSSTENKG
jgi:hypothetical protein